MKTKSRIRLGVLSSLAVSMVIALIAFSILKGMNTELRRSQTYSIILDETQALNVLTASFKEGSGRSDIRQVKGILSSLDGLLKGISSRVPREEVLIRQLQKNNQELGPLIDQMFVSGQGRVSGRERERRQILASQIWMKVRFISDDTNRLMDISQSRMIAAQEKAGAMVFVLIVILALTNGGIYFFSGRGIVRAQEALRQSEESLRVTLSSIGDAVIATDASGIVTFINPVAVGLTGWLSEEATDQTIQNVFQVINEQTRRPAENIIEHVLREGGIVSLANHTALITRDGREIPIEDSAAPIRDSGGNITGVVLVFHDVTEKRRAQEALRESENRLRRFYESGLLGVIYWNMDGEITDANDKFLEMVGYDREDLAAGPIDWGCMTPPEYRHLDEQSVVELIATGVNQKPFEKEYIRKDGSRIPIIVAGAMIDEARISGVAFVLDITERKRAEEALQKRTSELLHLTETLEDRVKERTAELADLSSRLVSAQENERKRVSYDLHDNVWQTLVAIRFEIERLFADQDRMDRAALQDKSKKIMAAILDTVGKIRSMQGDLWPYVLDDIGILATIDWYRREFERGHPGITIERKEEAAEIEILPSAKIVIYRILQETLNNVAQHSRANHVALRLLKKDHRMEFSIEDNGVGFDLEKTMVKRSPWGGLGLLSIKARTELFGGTFGIESVPDRGTTVRASWLFQENDRSINV